VTDSPDPDHDSRLAKHIIKTNYAGDQHTARGAGELGVHAGTGRGGDTGGRAGNDAELLRKYIAHAKRSCYPTMTEEAKDLIEEFYVNLRSKGADEDAPVPVTARKLEAMVRLAEASARVRLSDTVERIDADRATDIVESCLKDIGVDPETGQFDADVVETGTSKSQRDRIKNIKGLIADIEEEYQEGAPVEEVLDRAGEIGMDPGKAEREIEKLRTKGEVYEPQQGHLRTTLDGPDFRDTERRGCTPCVRERRRRPRRHRATRGGGPPTYATEFDGDDDVFRAVGEDPIDGTIVVAPSAPAARERVLALIGPDSLEDVTKIRGDSVPEFDVERV